MSRAMSDSAAWVESALGVNVCGMGQLRSLECSEVAHIAIDINLRHPALEASRHPQKPMRAVAPSLPLILTVDRPRHVSQVRKPVVAAASVNVVDVGRWPGSVRVEPSQSVGKVLTTKNSDREVSLVVLAASNVSDLDAVGCPHQSRKHSRARVISQDATQVVSAKIFVSHIGLLNRLIGQRLGRIGSAHRASSFYQLGAAT